MDYQVEITRDAEEGAEAIVAYIAADAPNRAAQWLQRFYELSASLCRHPERCGLAPESSYVDFSVRQLRHGNYRILFTIQETTVYVLHVRHAARRFMKAADLSQP